MTKTKLRRCEHAGCRKLTMRERCDDHRMIAVAANRTLKSDLDEVQATVLINEAVRRVDVQERRDQLVVLKVTPPTKTSEVREEPRPRFAD